MESTSEPVDSLIDSSAEGVVAPQENGLAPQAAEGYGPHSAGGLQRLRGRLGGGHGGFARAFATVRFALVVYLSTRVLLIGVALINGPLRDTPLLNEFTNWDGFWYRSVAHIWYPDHISHLQTNLGFFPLYPLTMRAFSYLFSWTTPYGLIGGITVAGILISMIGGFVTTVLIQRMATDWWDKEAGRRAVLLFCLFPGSVVFSMVYAEGLAIPLAAGCVYALTRRRWVLAGILAGIATAVEPEAFSLIVVCAVSALLEFRRQGWSFRRARRSLWAPLLAPLGAAGFGAYLWVQTGSPFASFIAQHDGWRERTSPFALIHDAKLLANEISFNNLSESSVNLNYVVGLVGAVLLIIMLVLLFKQRRRVPVEAILWTLGISFLMLTSWNIPPNPRLLITAFPLLMVVAYYVRGRWFKVLLWINGGLLAGLSALTFVGLTLRP